MIGIMDSNLFSRINPLLHNSPKAKQPPCQAVSPLIGVKHVLSNESNISSA